MFNGSDTTTKTSTKKNKSQKSFLSFFYISECKSVTELYKIVTELHLWNNAKYIRYKNTFELNKGYLC